MTRFIYLADTHLGANPLGYQQQRGYPDKLENILAALRDYILASGSIDFVLHGGDMIDAATEENILAAGTAFDLPVPVYLCLGNHDLTTPDAVERWLGLAPRFFGNRAPDYMITTEDCVIHVVPNHWCDIPLYWGDTQSPHFSGTQAKRLKRNSMMGGPGLPHLLVTHSPVYGLPPAQTGFAEPFHAPPPSFTSQVWELLAQNERMGCVLGAHNHMNMRASHEGVEFVTASSLIETPFEFKLFEVTPERVAMSTLSLHTALDFAGVYDATRAFVQGRDVDRAFSTAK